ncbi:MAG: DUF6089 family protein [Bacteroidota bacterium]|nr:DUF6089 family protein [Bacteroidota bacterium]
MSFVLLEHFLKKFRKEPLRVILLIIFLNLLFLTENQKLYGQRTEVGVFGGCSYYLGDLNPKIHFLGSKPALGLIHRYNFNPRFAWKNSILLGWIGTSDQQSKADVNRNLSFRSTIAEISTQIEFNFLDYMTSDPKYPISPYIFVGFSMFTFNPQANYNGQWYDLQPLSTEGEGLSEYPDRKTYSLVQAALPFGFGFKTSIASQFCFGIEWGMRKTWTDYLDDVSTTYADPNILASEISATSSALSNRTIKGSGYPANITGIQRGNSNNNDWYSFTGFFFTYKIPRSTSCPAFKKKKPILYL